MGEPAKIEWKDARTHREPQWPLLGYAPGNYMGRCRKCDGRFHDMDKRAYHCLPCAVEAVAETIKHYVEANAALQKENDAFRAVVKLVTPTEGATHER